MEKENIPKNSMGLPEGCLEMYEDKDFGHSKCGIVDLCPKCQTEFDKVSEKIYG